MMITIAEVQIHIEQTDLEPKRTGLSTLHSILGYCCRHSNPARDRAAGAKWEH